MVWHPDRLGWRLNLVIFALVAAVVVGRKAWLWWLAN